METVQGGVPPYGVKETLVVNGKMVVCGRICTYVHANVYAYVSAGT